MIQLSDHFSYGRLLRFTWPPMLMMVFISVYGVVDGLIVSNFTGTTPFAALNLIWPFVNVLGAVGFMFGTGGSALVAKTLGEGRDSEARNIFSLLTYSVIAIGVTLGVTGAIFVREVAILLGAEGEMIEQCVTYGRIMLIMLPTFMLQIYFQSLIITAERPKMGMKITLAAGLTNMALDLLFVGQFHWGLAGAAWATGISQCLCAFIPLAFFAKRRHPSLKLRLGRCTIAKAPLIKTATNGISEFVMQISLSIVSMLYMTQLLREAGENGVAAYGIMMYFAFTFSAVFIGFSIGVAPIISYHYGAKNTFEMHNLLKKSLTAVAVGGAVVVLIAQVFARPLSAIFVSYDEELLSLTTHAFRIYSLFFLVTGINIFASSFFTALNNGPISALISLLRTLVLEVTCVLVLPMIFGIEGIWWSVDVAEGIAMVVALLLIKIHRPRYGY